MNIAHVCLWLSSITPQEVFVIVPDSDLYAYIKPATYTEQVNKLCSLENFDMSLLAEIREEQGKNEEIAGN
jgi:hypothetical protein